MGVLVTNGTWTLNVHVRGAWCSPVVTAAFVGPAPILTPALPRYLGNKGNAEHGKRGVERHQHGMKLLEADFGYHPLFRKPGDTFQVRSTFAPRLKFQ
jgi:hypothetical protein